MIVIIDHKWKNDVGNVKKKRKYGEREKEDVAGLLSSISFYSRRKLMIYYVEKKNGSRELIITEQLKWILL